VLKASKLGQWAPDVLRGFVQTIFQDSPNLRFATPYGPMEMSAGEFFTQPAEVQDALKRSVIDPITLSRTSGADVRAARCRRIGSFGAWCSDRK